ncbi:hypothetical protein ACIPF8_23540 [Collimonas sp. NPDC087041]|uniref:hypothetical protein n=1 Tax=Collimonas sp. NPDC087041 TaxID=3363960 RepID=UPI0037F2BA28
MIGIFAALTAGCAVSDGGYGGYGYSGGVGVGLDYYEPFGGDYGGWGPGYQVGPFRGGGDHRGGGGRGGQHAFRSAPASHSMPSIPSRGGGGGGGGHSRSR